MRGTLLKMFIETQKLTCVAAVATICSLTLTHSAWANSGAANSTPQPTPAGIVTALKDSRRRPRTERKHFYNWRGPVEYIYDTADGDTVALPDLIKSVPDKRLYAKRHPVKLQVNRVRGVIVWASPFWSLAYGIGTAIAR